MTHTPVFLRNGEAATVTGRINVAPFALLGRRNSGTLEMWQEQGEWREDGREHPLDIVSFVTPGGGLVALKENQPPQ
ncbi:MAG: hypothetical protein HZA93_23695 [Verrucomicrobia bacterium]|nr:hypothetical protein [Verrucomicrobiota bacterium]